MYLNKIILTLVSCCLFILFATSAQAGWDFGWHLKKYTRTVNDKIDIAEKQSKTLIKMLKKEKYLKKIQSDLNIYKKGKTLKKDDVYLYKVFNKLDMSLLETEVDLQPLFPINRKKFPEKKTDTKMHNERYSQLLSPQFLLSYTLGLVGSIHSNLIYVKKDFFSNDNVDDFLNNCESLLAIQRPLHLIAKQKLDIKGLIKRDNTKFRFNKNQLKSNSYGAQDPRFWFLIPKKNTFLKKRWLEESNLENKPLEYLNFLKDLFNFLDEVEYKYHEKYREWGSFLDLADYVDEVISEKSEELQLEDLEDLKDNKGDKGEKTKQSEGSDELDIDDLEMPE